MKDTNTTSAEDLKTIRKIMEESTRFFSLSGLSGIIPGLIAIAGALYIYFFLPAYTDSGLPLYKSGMILNQDPGFLLQLIAVAMVVLVLSIIVVAFTSYRKMKTAGMSLWSPVSRRFIINLLVPLVSGGLFVIILLVRGDFQMVIPSLLVFYGLALVNAGKFTYNEVFYFGIIEIATGLISAFFPQFWLLFWVIGFGILHIIYGVFMYRKYEA